MFTGLIETTGTVFAVEEHEGSTRIAIDAPGLKLRTGDSIAVSGVCLTALDIEPGRFHADLAAETIARTSLSLLAPGATVNLELPTPAGAPLGGHVVQGHVDATGKLLSLEPAGKGADWWLRIAVPEMISRYVVEKGSIAVEGISLTVARWEPGTDEGDVVSIAIIPHTYAHTNLHNLQVGQPVNIEADVLIKFMEQRALPKPSQSSLQERELTVEYLIANGY
ncbi:MAG TPA: riboflavin synthase [Acidobacteriaceae bacterium]|nr:riboflavin synthase [Acidobacteriaceae bacterium]